MPFDGNDFQPRRRRPHRVTGSDNLVSIMIVVIAVTLLVVPFSVAGLVDIVEYFRRG